MGKPAVPSGQALPPGRTTASVSLVTSCLPACLAYRCARAARRPLQISTAARWA